jgi:sugar phosphate isomerase/epimerase
MCYAPDRDFLKEYGSRLLMTHLNDNYGITDPAGKLQGTDDLHLIPYQGIGNWEQILKRLKGAKAQEILNFELKIRPKGDRCKVDLYSKMPLEEYLRKAYLAACNVTADYFE